jgi:hypothetical protein
MKNAHRPQLLRAPISLKTEPAATNVASFRGELHQMDGGSEDGSLPVAVFSLSARRSPADLVESKKPGRDNSQFNNIGKQREAIFQRLSLSLRSFIIEQSCAAFPRGAVCFH